jgi:hypothetical protein
MADASTTTVQEDSVQLAPNFEREAERAEFLRRKNIETAKAGNLSGKLKPFPRTAQK